jgi:heat shock protein HslJ
MQLESLSLRTLSIHILLCCSVAGATGCDLNKNIGQETDTGDGQTDTGDGGTEPGDGQTNGDDGDDDSTGNPGDEPSLEGRDFISQEVRWDGELHQLVAGTSLRIGFDAGGPTMGASAGCNSMSGSYSVADGQFVVSDGGSTDMGCEPDLMEQEQWYFEFLSQSSAITVTEEELILDGGSIYIRYLDEEIATPDEDLVGPTWEVDTILEDGGAWHAEWPEPATLEFADDGTVAAYSGCNTGSGEYVTNGAEIQFTGLAFTEEACVDQESQYLEDAVLRTLVSDVWMSWEIDASQLTIQNGSDGLVLNAQG